MWVMKVSIIAAVSAMSVATFISHMYCQKKAFYWFDETDDKLQLQKKRTAAVDGLIRSQLFCFP